MDEYIGQSSTNVSLITAITGQVKITVPVILQRGINPVSYAWDAPVETMRAVDPVLGPMSFEVFMISTDSVPTAMIVVLAFSTGLSKVGQ